MGMLNELAPLACGPAISGEAAPALIAQREKFPPHCARDSCADGAEKKGKTQGRLKTGRFGDSL
jgi:hypothetical protein